MSASRPGGGLPGRGTPNVRSYLLFCCLDPDVVDVKVTGCIRPELLSRLNPNDGGGQYDSSGGAGGFRRGNPAGSKCLGYVLPLFCCALGADTFYGV